MKVGHFTLDMRSMFLNLSLIKKDTYRPAASLTISLIEVNGDIKSNAQGFFLEASNVAGPVPIDLPNKMIFDSAIPCA